MASCQTACQPGRLRRQGELGHFSTALTAQASQKPSPWHLGYQLNERYLEWGTAPQTQLIKMFCAKELDIDVSEINERVDSLVALLPDLAPRIPQLKAHLLLELLKRQEHIPEILLQLKLQFPHEDAGMMACQHPALLTDHTVESLRTRLQQMREQLPSVPDIGKLVAAEPKIIDADIPELIESIKRLLPNADPIAYLLKNPGMVGGLSNLS